MLEDFLITVNSLVPSWTGESLPPEALPLPYISSALGALVLTKFTGSFGSLTIPLNCSVLFLGAMISTWLLQGIELPMDRAVHQPLLVSMIGMLVGAFAMMLWLRSDNLHA